MVDLKVSGLVKGFIGKKNGQYFINTKYNQRKNKWILHIENTDGVWREDIFLSEFEVDNAAKEVATQISRGELFF